MWFGNPYSSMERTMIPRFMNNSNTSAPLRGDISKNKVARGRNEGYPQPGKDREDLFPFGHDEPNGPFRLRRII